MIQVCGPEASKRLASIHQAAFEDGWSASAISELMGRGVVALASKHGFILTRAVAGEAEVLTLAVAPDARRRGEGRALVEAAVLAAKGDGATTLFLEVAVDNAAAVGLYASCGFERAGRRRGYYARRGGPAMDALVLRRTLLGPA